MFRMVITSGHRVLAEISQHRTPDRVALGIALGTSFGLVPMDNLLSASLLLAILFLPIHHLSAAIAFLLMGWLSPVLAPIPAGMGAWILSHAWIRSIVAALHGYPLVPWFRLNNTLVVGGFALGICTWIPQAITFRWLARRTQRQLADWAVEEMADEAVRYRKAVAASHRFKAMTQRATPSLAIESQTSEIDSSPMDFPLTDASRRFRAVPLADIDVDRQLRIDDPATAVPMVLVDAEAALPSETNFPETILRETIIEVVRLRQPIPHFSSPIESKPEMAIVETRPVTVSDPNSAPPSMPAIPMVVPNSQSMRMAYDSSHQPLVGPKSSNSLRYLLRYLSSNRDARDSAENRS